MGNIARINKWGVPTSKGTEYFNTEQEAEDRWDEIVDKGEPKITGPVIPPPKDAQFLFFDDDPPGLWLMDRSGIPNFLEPVKDEKEARFRATKWPYSYVGVLKI